MGIRFFAIYLSISFSGCSSERSHSGVDYDHGVYFADQASLNSIISNAIPEKSLRMSKKTGGEVVFHVPNDQTPYTGWAKVTYENGQVEFLNQYKNGKLNGPYTMWYENGR